VIIASPTIAWFQVENSTKGLLIGVGIALMIIGVEILIKKIALDTLIFAAIGAVSGLLFSLIVEGVISYVFKSDLVDNFFVKYSTLIKLVMTYLGLMVAVLKKNELDKLDKDILVRGTSKKSADVKILDTSAIIDGRIADIAETKFLSGILVVPQFILLELQAVADSADDQKRARGRRGMEILEKIQEDSTVPVKIYDRDFPEIKDTDAKLVQLAKELNGKIITTDFNLNKIAAIQGIPVLNVNELAQALKPIVLPGKKMMIFVVKDGKERSQGVGYLDDGTMVVVEDGKPAVGKRVEVHVNSILQTSAGRMIFARICDK
ncbi:MAG: PIN domain-containing protein, partial [bacterium]